MTDQSDAAFARYMRGEIDYDQLLNAESRAVEAEYGKPVDQITEEDVQQKRAEHGASPDLSERPVCNCPTIAGEKVKCAYCLVHGADAAMDALNALSAEAKTEPRVSTVLNNRARQPDSYDIRIVWEAEKDDWQAHVYRNGDVIGRSRPDDFDAVVENAAALVLQDRRSRVG